jgi:hypothetical protein
MTLGWLGEDLNFRAYNAVSLCQGKGRYSSRKNETQETILESFDILGLLSLVQTEYLPQKEKDSVV